jgi:hypothetical protein
LKRDMDLVRELLIQITDNNLLPHEEWSDGVIYHLKMLSDVGYIKGIAFMQAYQGLIAAPSNPQLTWPGHEFLDTIKSQTVWDKIKNVIKDKGVDLSVEAIKIAAPNVLASILK